MCTTSVPSAKSTRHIIAARHQRVKQKEADVYRQNGLEDQPSPEGNVAAHAHAPESLNSSSARQFTLGDALTAGGGLFVFLFSFLPFVAYDHDLTEVLKSSSYPTWFSAWAGETFMAPLTWCVTISALALVGLVAVRYFTHAPIRIITFSLSQIEIVLGLFSTVVLVSYAFAAKSVLFGAQWANSAGGSTYQNGLHFGIGGYLMLVFAFVAAVGTFLSAYRVGPVLFPQAPLANTDTVNHSD